MLKTDFLSAAFNIRLTVPHFLAYVFIHFTSHRLTKGSNMLDYLMLIVLIIYSKTISPVESFSPYLLMSTWHLQIFNDS